MGIECVCGLCIAIDSASLHQQRLYQQGEKPDVVRVSV
jgi:hypothetical protein